MRRHPDFSRPLPRPLTWRDSGWMLGALLFGLLVIFAIYVISAPYAHAHDIWISKGSYRNPAGEWCCGASDCGVVAPSGIKAVQGGYSIRSTVTYGVGITGNEADGPTHSEPVDELVPYSQSLPSPDGSFWRCKRPDGSNRCFFAPKPSM